MKDGTQTGTCPGRRLRTPPAATRALTAALCSLVLAGCGTGPREAGAPALPGGAAFHNEATDDHTPAAASKAPNPPPTRGETNREWWRGLGDGELEALIADSLAHNPSLDSLAARIDEARARLGLAAAERSPALSASGSARLAGESAERTLPLPGRPVHYRDSGDAYRLALEASWEPDLWGRVRSARRGAAAQLAAAEEDLRAGRLSLSAEVAVALFTLRGLAAEEALLERTRELRGETAALLSSRLAAGLSHEAEVQRALSEQALAAAEHAELGRRRGLARNALALLLGKSVSEVQRQLHAAPPPPPAVPAGLPAEVLRRRPDIAAAEQRLNAAAAEIGVAEAARYPTIRLTAGGGFESADLGSLLGRPSQFWQLGPTFSWPVLDGGRTKAALRIAIARAEAARADHRQRCLQALREVEDALVERRQLSRQAEALQAGRDAAFEALKLLRSRHEGGLVSQLEVLDAERSLLQFERTLLQNDVQQRCTFVRLVRALGGSLQTDS